VTVPSVEVGSLLDCDLSKVVIIGHSYVPDLYPPKLAMKREVEDPIIVRHIGSLSGSRTLQPLMDAFDHLCLPSKQGIRLELIGGTPPLKEEQHLRSRFDLAMVAERVGYVESLKLMASADGLVVCGEQIASSPFIPSKFADYVGASRPILLICRPGSLFELGREHGIPMLVGDDVAQDARELARFLDMCSSSPEIPSELSRKFSTEYVSGVFGAAVEDLLRGKENQS